MTLEVFLSIAGFTGALIAGSWAILRVGMAQFERRLDDRFAALEVSRADGRKQWNEQLARMEAKHERFEQGLTKLLIELPREYVRREDWVRSQTIIEAKLDSLALRIENALLKGGRDDG